MYTTTTYTIPDTTRITTIIYNYHNTKLVLISIIIHHTCIIHVTTSAQQSMLHKLNFSNVNIYTYIYFHFIYSLHLKVYTLQIFFFTRPRDIPSKTCPLYP